MEAREAELEPFLRADFYGGRSFWRLFETPLLWTLGLIYGVLAAREWFIRRVREERLRHDTMLTELRGDKITNRREGRRIIRWSNRLLKQVANSVVKVIAKGRRKRNSLRYGPTPAMSSHPASVGLLPSITDKQLETGLSRERKTQLSAAVKQADAPGQRQAITPPSDALNKRVKRDPVFPGAARDKSADQQPAAWDESQWID